MVPCPLPLSVTLEQHPCPPANEGFTVVSRPRSNSTTTRPRSNSTTVSRPRSNSSACQNSKKVATVSRPRSNSTASHNAKTVSRPRSDSTASQHSKVEIWKGAIERQVGDGAVAQILGLESKKHVVWARVIKKNQDSSETSPPPQVSVLTAVQAMVDEEFDHLVKDILEHKRRLETDARPPADELIRLGAVWLVNESEWCEGKSKDGHAHRLSPLNAQDIPNWNDMTMRVHYQPGRHHAANEVAWSKYCRGLLVGQKTVEASIGGVHPPAPWKSLPDSVDGAIVYENENLGFAILNKPGAMPGFACRSNNLENVTSKFHEALKELWPKSHRKISVTLPHHVDSEVGGLIIVSTRKEFGTYCEQNLKLGSCPSEEQKEEAEAADPATPPIVPSIVKTYRCLVAMSDPNVMDKLQHMQEVGNVVTHYYDPKNSNLRKRFTRNHPKTVDHRWTKCQLKITGIGSGADVPFRAASVTSQFNHNNDPEITLAHRLWKSDLARNPAQDIGAQFVMELEVEDWSDKPHHLPGQLAALGAPIIGDALHGGGISETGCHHHIWKRMALQCNMISFQMPQWQDEDKQGDEGIMIPSDQRAYFHLGKAWWSIYLDEYNASVMYGQQVMPVA